MSRAPRSKTPTAHFQLSEKANIIVETVKLKLALKGEDLKKSEVINKLLEKVNTEDY
jgi:hypothetical protein